MLHTSGMQSRIAAQTECMHGELQDVHNMLSEQEGHPAHWSPGHCTEWSQTCMVEGWTQHSSNRRHGGYFQTTFNSACTVPGLPCKNKLKQWWASALCEHGQSISGCLIAWPLGGAGASLLLGRQGNLADAPLGLLGDGSDGLAGPLLLGLRQQVLEDDK
eukprot:669010-Lingulodinium_polyedra.AAC.1